MYNNNMNNMPGMGQGGMNPQQPMNNGMNPQQPMMGQPMMGQQPMGQMGMMNQQPMGMNNTGMQRPPYQQPMNNGMNNGGMNMMGQTGAPQKKNNMPLIIGAVALVVVIAVVAFFFLGGKKLVCTSDTGVSKVTYTYAFDRDGKKMKKYTTEIVYNLEGYSDEEVNSVVNMNQGDCDDYAGKSGISCKVKKSGNKVTVKVSMEIGKVKKEDYDLSALETVDFSKAKENMTNAGYSCK